jgi:glycosyltransferase involved in cell wall biosynthesis
MNYPQIVSPVPKGSGAFVLHRLLEQQISGYRVIPYNPYLEFFPILFPALTSLRDASLIHSPPDHAIYFRRRPLPLVITFHNYVLDRSMRPYSSWLQKIHYRSDLRFWTRMAVQKADAITAVSRFTRALVNEDLNISRPIRVIYNGIDTDLFTPATPSKTPRRDVRVFFCGNLTRRKGVQWLPSIAKRIRRNIRIMYTCGLRATGILPSTEGLHRLGPIPFDEMPNRYREMDILLLPTVREGFGLAIAEAMACGLPVVASDCSAVPELIDNGRGGFLCSVGDVEGFAEKINFLADSPKLRREMGEYNRVKAEKMFTLRRMVNEYKELFESILG